jgi:hypothetical protein
MVSFSICVSKIGFLLIVSFLFIVLARFLPFSLDFSPLSAAAFSLSFLLASCSRSW